MKLAKKIITVIVTFAMVFSISVVPVSAVDYTNKTTFWNMMAAQGGLLQDIVGLACGSACPDSEDGKHHASSYLGDDTGRGYYDCVCSYCGEHFKAYDSDLSTAYNNYVDTLPATGYTSAGGLIWQPTFEDCYSISPWDLSCKSYSSLHLTDFPCFVGNVNSTSLDSRYRTYCSILDNCSLQFSFNGDASYFLFGGLRCGVSLTVPVTGSYRPLNSIEASGSGLLSDGTIITFGPYYYSGSFSHCNAGSQIEYSTLHTQARTDVSSMVVVWTLPKCEIVPDTALTVYPDTTRPTSITGDYGIIGDDGTITKVDGNYIIDESTSTIYNPVTNTTTNITNWTYDYSDRSYTCTTESGDTVTITYGDENVTINEGDTIYNVYYITEGSGADTPACDHDYTSTVTTEPTCTVKGVRTYTCSKCGNTYTEQIPANGHTWVVKKQVTTEYDENGNLVTQGYTLYECSVCGEQYKDETGAGPPSTGGSGDPGEDVTEEGFFSWIWGVLKGLITTVVGGVSKVFEFLFGGDDTQGSLDFYNNPSTFDGTVLWSS